MWVILELPSLHLTENSKNIHFISFGLQYLTTLHFRCEKWEGTFLSYANQELKYHHFVWWFQALLACPSHKSSIKKVNTADSCNDTDRANCILRENALLLELCQLHMSHGLADYQSSGVPRGSLGGSNPSPPEIPKFWQSWAEFPVLWKIHL
jgi:hypothetical protein